MEQTSEKPIIWGIRRAKYSSIQLQSQETEGQTGEHRKINKKDETNKQGHTRETDKGSRRAGRETTNRLASHSSIELGDIFCSSVWFLLPLTDTNDVRNNSHIWRGTQLRRSRVFLCTVISTRPATLLHSFSSRSADDRTAELQENTKVGILQVWWTAHTLQMPAILSASLTVKYSTLTYVACVYVCACACLHP